MPKKSVYSLAVLKWNTRDWKDAKLLTKEEKLKLVIEHGFKLTKEEIDNNDWKPNY